MKIIILATLLITLIGCSSGSSFKAYSFWEEEKLPDGCIVKQIAAGGSQANVAILCEDGRVFH